MTLERRVALFCLFLLSAFSVDFENIRISLLSLKRSSLGKTISLTLEPLEYRLLSSFLTERRA